MHLVTLGLIETDLHLVVFRLALLHSHPDWVYRWVVLS